MNDNNQENNQLQNQPETVNQTAIQTQNNPEANNQQVLNQPNEMSQEPQPSSTPQQPTQPMNNAPKEPIIQAQINLPKDKKSLIIGGATIGMVLLLVILRSFLGGSAPNKPREYNPDNEEKIVSKLNKHYEEKDYVLQDGTILVEIKNNNKEAVDVKIKVEFYDENKNVIKVNEPYILGGIGAKCTSYTKTLEAVPEAKSYDVKVKLTPSYYMKHYENKIDILSQNDGIDSTIVQYKSNAKDTIKYLEIGLLYYDNNNKIIAFSYQSEDNVDAGNTDTIEIRAPYNTITYDRITYSKAKPVIISAYG